MCAPRERVIVSLAALLWTVNVAQSDLSSTMYSKGLSFDLFSANPSFSVSTPHHLIPKASHRNMTGAMRWGRKAFSLTSFRC
jgi:hypothetical protein